MEIWKFGGSCLIDSESYRLAAARVGQDACPRVIIVSAMRGVTDALEALLDGSNQSPDSLIELHRETWQALGGEDSEIEPWTCALQHALATDANRLRCWGDEVSAALCDLALREAGHEADLLDPGDLGLITDGARHRAKPIEEATKIIRDRVDRHKKTIVAPGFVGKDEAGRRTILGRNTGDYSAAIFASALAPATLRVFKGTEGIATADPELVPKTHTIERLTYDEAREMIHAGAPVLHPLALETAAASDIPIVLESLHPKASSQTHIHRDAGDSHGQFRALCHRRPLAFVELIPSWGHDGAGLLKTALEAFRDAEVPVDMSSASESGAQLAVRDFAGLPETLNQLGETASIHLERGFASITMVGAGILTTAGIESKSLALLAKEEVFPRMMSTQGTTPRLTFLVRDDQLLLALTLLHEHLA